MWGFEIEEQIRRVLLEVDPAYEKELSGGYFYRAMPSFYNKVHLRETVVYMDYYEVPSDARILDFGCGTGQFLLYCWYHGYRNLEGRDQNERWLVAARALFDELAPEANRNFVRSERADIYGDLSGGEQKKYDVVTMFGVVSTHKIKVKDVFEPVKAALNPGGYLFFNDYTYNPGQMTQWMRKAGLKTLVHTTVSNVGGSSTHFYIAKS